MAPNMKLKRESNSGDVVSGTAVVLYARLNEFG